MPLWQRLAVTVVAVLAVSFLVGFIWQRLFGFGLPSYAAGVTGGLAAVPLWEFLKRIKAKEK